MTSVPTTRRTQPAGPGQAAGPGQPGQHTAGQHTAGLTLVEVLSSTALLASMLLISSALLTGVFTSTRQSEARAQTRTAVIAASESLRRYWSDPTPTGTAAEPSTAGGDRLGRSCVAGLNLPADLRVTLWDINPLPQGGEDVSAAYAPASSCSADEREDAPVRRVRVEQIGAPAGSQQLTFELYVGAPRNRP